MPPALQGSDSEFTLGFEKGVRFDWSLAGSARRRLARLRIIGIRETFAGLGCRALLPPERRSSIVIMATADQGNNHSGDEDELGQ